MFCSTLLPGSVAVNMINNLGHGPKFRSVSGICPAHLFCVLCLNSKCELIQSAIHGVVGQCLAPGTQEEVRILFRRCTKKELKCSIAKS